MGVLDIGNDLRDILMLVQPRHIPLAEDYGGLLNNHTSNGQLSRDRQLCVSRFTVWGTVLLFN